MTTNVGPVWDSFFRQLEVAQKEAAKPLANEPEFLALFERARAAMHVYFASRDADEPAAHRAATAAMVELVVGGRVTAPVLARLQGSYFQTQIFAWVLYRVVHDLGGTELAERIYAQYAPRAIAGKPDLRELRKVLGMRQPEGRTPGYEIGDAADLRRRIRSAGDELARRQMLITAGAIAKAIGVDEKRLRIWTRQLGLGELKAVTRAERDRHRQRLKRPRR